MRRSFRRNGLSQSTPALAISTGGAAKEIS
jgi:hypothetical protein